MPEETRRDDIPGTPASPGPAGPAAWRGNMDLAKYNTPGRVRSWNKRKLKIEQLLPPAVLAEFEDLLRDNRSTTVSALRWLRDRGFGDISVKAVKRYRLRFDARMTDVRAAAELAMAYARAARRGRGVADFSEAALLRFQQLQMQRLFDLNKAAELSTREWTDVARAIGTVVGTQRQVDRLRRPLKAPGRPGRKPNGKSDARADGRAVADRVRQILGMPPATDAEAR